MASHTKETTKVKTKFPTIPGTKPSIRNAQLLISTGILPLDNIIGSCTYFVSLRDNYSIISIILIIFFRRRFTYWFNTFNWYVFK